MKVYVGVIWWKMISKCRTKWLKASSTFSAYPATDPQDVTQQQCRLARAKSNPESANGSESVLKLTSTLYIQAGFGRFNIISQGHYYIGDTIICKIKNPYSE